MKPPSIEHLKMAEAEATEELRQRLWCRREILSPEGRALNLDYGPRFRANIRAALAAVWALRTAIRRREHNAEVMARLEALGGSERVEIPGHPEWQLHVHYPTSDEDE